MFKNEGGGVKGRLNNVKKNRRFGTGESPLVSEILAKSELTEIDEYPEKKKRIVRGLISDRKNNCYSYW